MQARNTVILSAFVALAAASPAFAQQRLQRLIGTADGDHFGWAVRGAGDVDNDGRVDLLISAPFADVAGADTGQISIISGSTGSTIRTREGTTPGDWFGWSLTVIGDTNGDGRPDYVIGAPGATRGGRKRTGVVQLLSGLDASPLFTVEGLAANDFFGTSVAALGDVNNDGWPDFAVGAPGDPRDLTAPGRVVIHSGRTGARLRELIGNTQGERFGESVAGIGDVTGDGRGDLVVGSPLFDSSNPDSGAARLINGATGALVRSWTGASANAQFGYSVSAAGDQNNDGVPDIAVGARFEFDRGRVHTLSGSNGNTIRVTWGPTRSMWFGSNVVNGGDIDQDGTTDLLIGSPLQGVKPAKAAMPIRGMVTIHSGTDDSILYFIQGNNHLDWMGHGVSGVGDTNGDGIPDILVGAPVARNGKGEVHLYAGGQPTMKADKMVLSIRNGGSQALTIDAGPTHAGEFFLVIGSASGIFPGIRLGQAFLPLTFDPYLSYTVSNPNLLPLTLSLGALDSQGRANARFEVPAGFVPTTFLSESFYHSALLLKQGGGFTLATNPIPVTFDV